MTTQIKLERFAEFMAANPSPNACEVGRFYNVPCFSHQGTSKLNKYKGWGKWVPLIGPLHEDKEIIDFPYYHIHVDTRFITFDGFFKKKPSDLLAYPLCLTGRGYYQKIQVEAILEVRRLKCRQSEPPPFPDGADWHRAMEDAHADCRAINGLCPHRGFPLACGREIAPGVRQCPGHGLAWDSEGALVRLLA